jgi:hypothetical protein
MSLTTEKMHKENMCLLFMGGALLILIGVYFMAVKPKLKKSLVADASLSMRSGNFKLGPEDGYIIVRGKNAHFSASEKESCKECLDPARSPYGATYSGIGGCVTNPQALGGYTVEFGKPVANSMPIGPKFSCDAPGIAVRPQ